MTAVFTFPNRILFGEGTQGRLAEELARWAPAGPWS